MRQQVKVVRHLNHHLVEVSMTRMSACGHDCGSCGGGCASTEVITVPARNLIGARPGDQVFVETKSSKILSLAALMYIMPVILFFAFYFWGQYALPGFELALGLLGFALSLLICVFVNKRMVKKNSVSFDIVMQAGDGE